MAVYPSQHPLVKHKMSLLRDDIISVKNFRELANEISSILMIEATLTT
jgi:uracil phosphoribosyltransferase